MLLDASAQTLECFAYIPAPALTAFKLINQVTLMRGRHGQRGSESCTAYSCLHSRSIHPRVRPHSIFFGSEIGPGVRSRVACFSFICLAKKKKNYMCEQKLCRHQMPNSWGHRTCFLTPAAVYWQIVRLSQLYCQILVKILLPNACPLRPNGCGDTIFFLFFF